MEANSLIDVGSSTNGANNMFYLNGATVSVGERSRIHTLGGWPLGQVLLDFLGVRFSIGAGTNFTIQESSAVSFTNGTVSISDEVSIYFSKGSVFTVQRADDQPSLSVLKGAVLSFGLNSWLLVDNGYIYIGTYSTFSTGKNCEVNVGAGSIHLSPGSKVTAGKNSVVYVGPGTFHLGPGSKVEISEGSSIKVYGKPSEDSLVLHDNAALQISTDTTLIVGNSSLLLILPSKTVSIGERSKLEIADHMYCLVISDVAIPKYTEVEIDSTQGNPSGLSCFPTSQFSDDIGQFKAQYGIP